MELVIILLALGMLMFVAYRGFSVILFAPICALFAVLLTEPSHVLPFFSNVFMEKMVGFIKLYFPVFLLGAIFGKVVEMSGIAESIAKTIIQFVGVKRSMLAIVLMGAILTYSGVSVFVVAFAVYPFAANLFREANIPKRLIPGTIALGAITFTMDALPGTPQIQNVIPTTFFKTDIYAAPVLGTIGAIFVFVVGMLYLERRCKQAAKNGEGYDGLGDGAPEMAASLEPKQNIKTAIQVSEITPLRQVLAFVPLILVGVMNKFFTAWIPIWYPKGFDFTMIGLKDFGKVELSAVLGVWSVELALLIGIVTTIILNWKRLVTGFQAGLNASIGGALLAAMNTGAEYGFGGVIAALPGFGMIRDGISTTFTNPLVNGAVTTNVLAGITGSASGGMGIALSAMAEKYMAAAEQYHIPFEVMHRVISMAAGGMDTLPHNGAVITLLAVTGLTHKQSYRDIFAITIIKTLAVFVVIGIYRLTGIV
ncbi:GntP family permease [Bacillus cytotoxicus]|uniref:Citrate transporter n=1 Tax=Bacillus cytotoxicus (strain DSM 22905 / CIP 110041 / 391-98 / NVH 391-98) TaxID=315749 RepID=A7GP80_BACCN|nr:MULTISPECIES: GntP family permease [Bacillus cereus group]ABS21938.1 Citrate transporter [Bacillus cytotoxicus NVH 391-98]AWC36597.1 transporter [Bacillus cytotoxicus]AWC44625.1 transporter [Bacillus cytotoxicus]AWC60851.1 transporter [Bacillus cytotoxicus]KMT51041.1 transporter [Bacillus cytotoxicus]